MTTRRAACSCGQLHLTIEGEPSRISMCHCLECQRRTGAVISNQARFRREQVTFAGQATAWMRTAESGNALTFHFCPDMRLHRLLGGRRLPWIRRRCHRHLRRPEFPRADHRGVGGVPPPLGLAAARSGDQARGEAGVMRFMVGLVPTIDPSISAASVRRDGSSGQARTSPRMTADICAPGSLRFPRSRHTVDPWRGSIGPIQLSIYRGI